MSTYCDGVHLVADTEEELHQFANKIGLQRNWFQGPHNGHKIPHYDVMSKYKKRLAFQYGAEQVRSRDIVLKFRKKELEKRGFKFVETVSQSDPELNGLSVDVTGLDARQAAEVEAIQALTI